MMTHNESLYSNVLDYFNVTNKHDRRMIVNRLSKEYAKHSYRQMESSMDVSFCWHP